MFKIDFGDPAKQMRQEQQKELHLQKDKILKKIVIIEDAKASNDKHFTQHHRSNMRKMQQLNDIKRQMLEQLKAQDLLYEEKQQQLKFFMQQKEARGTLLKRRRQMEEKLNSTNAGDASGAGLAQSVKLPSLPLG